MFDMRTIIIGIIGFSMVLSLPGMLIGPAEIRSTNYTDPEVCSGCHAQIYAQWNGSMHSNAQKDPVYQKLLQIASRETNRSFDAFCTRCHAPVAYLSGISCDFCHTVNGIGNGSFAASPGKVKYGPLKDSGYSTFHSTAYSELHESADFCGNCHDVRHPFNGLALDSTYTEWKEGPYNETTPCQHCHMTPGITKFKKNPGKAAENGRMREHIYTHQIVGGNAMIPGLLGSPEYEKLAEERLRLAAKVEIEDMEIINNRSVNINVRVTNTGAGHKIPTGVARQIWLEINVTDFAGNQIFSSGRMDENGYIDPNAVIYHTVFGDSNGRPTEKVWLADSILIDNRIPPKGYAVENYNFTIPQNAKGPLAINVRLDYMPISQELSDMLFEKGRVRPPVVEMASANATLNWQGKKETPGFTSVTMILATLALFIAKRTNWPLR